jgi:hypothetical protein
MDQTARYARSFSREVQSRRCVTIPLPIPSIQALYLSLGTGDWPWLDGVYFATAIYIVGGIDYLMPSRIKDVVFSEPSGRRQAAVMFASSLAMLSIYIYYGVLRDGSSISSLIMAVGFALSGVAEALPTERRRIAGGLRVTAILWLTGLLCLTVFVPEVILGPR